ncbi:tetratricopeptide repeat protein [Porphyromonas gingivalis]|nr:tetratricopeptide repeat protein [Porphyromonas gingivalis]MDP0625316.1 tetratricopeptide repeat protein [Porphyromonas gingivalis]WKD53674.1 tetratricopeptide repeat protein [Porphyromonas gingivalis]
MNEELPKTITSRQLVRMLKDASGESKGTKFCFLIGAGASMSSGIPSGADLARKWIREIEEDCGKDDFAKWKNKVGISEDNVGEFYPQIYEKRFGHIPESGYDCIRHYMEGKEPSLGYLILANIMVREKHNVVITTNFDNLLEDAIRTYTKEKPFIAGHEALADYVPKRSDRPIILKLHRDLFLQPFSDQLNTDILQAAWESILGKFLSDYHLIVLGYGGNDGSLMNYLLKLKNRKPIYWCVRNADKATSKSLWNTLSPKAKRLLKNDGYLVPIDDFDRFMYDCYAALGYKFLEGIEKIEKPKSIHEILKPNYARIESIQTQLRQLSQTEEELSKESFQSIKSFLPDSWMWILQANQEKDIDKKDKIYREGIERYPQDADLLGDYADFLCDICHDYDRAEAYYKRALEADPNHANTLGNYALFLKDVRHAYDQAEAYYKRALAADPNHANNLGNYANFLYNIRCDYDQAETYYKKALEADPNHANTLGNYALFLKNIRHDYDQAEAYYKRALEADPKNANALGNYASFLHTIRHAYDQAEAYYKRALEANPKDANALGNYALFLHTIRHAYDQAEVYYKRALEADPNHANTLGNYALFLHTIRHAYDQAEVYYKRALEADPNHANTLGNYAVFLKDIRHAYDQAESYYKRALEADPKNAVTLGNYAVFLNDIRHDYDQAESYYKRALEADPKNAVTLGNYAVFLNDIRHDYDQAEAYYKRALEADPKNANTLGNYAVFLKNIRHDYDQAETYYKRALEVDPKSANKLGNYAHFLITCRGDLKRADSLIQQAFENADNDEETKPLQAKLWFYRYAHYYEEWGAEAEKELAALLNAGAKSIGWNLATDIELARKNRHLHIEQVEAFAKALTEKA